MNVHAVRARAPAPLIHGVDFTSAPRKAKPITIATGRIRAGALDLQALDELDNFHTFEAWLARPGPWVAGFDFPFGLPRQALRDLDWPQTLPELTRHCTALGRPAFRAALDRHRAARPVGAKFCYRRGDASASAHSPLKLVNPPVALMFLEGAARLVNAGIDIPGMVAGDPRRVALEAYPGFAVRQIFASRVPISYKNDARAKQTIDQHRMRKRILGTIVSEQTPFGIPLRASSSLLRALQSDGRGDLLDAALCALQAAWAWQRRDRRYGLPAGIDPVEGWIVTVPEPAALMRSEQRSGQSLQAFG